MEKNRKTLQAVTKKLSDRQAWTALVKSTSKRISHGASTLGKWLNKFAVNGINRPPSDIFHEEDKIHLSIELPGVSRDFIKIKSKGRSIEVSAEKAKSVKSRQGLEIQTERSYLRISRTFHFSDEIGGEIEAHLIDGVLYLEIPKMSLEKTIPVSPAQFQETKLSLEQPEKSPESIQ